MQTLPFLVVHGWWLAKLFVVAPGVVGVGVVGLIYRHRPRRFAAIGVAVLLVLSLASYLSLRALGESFADDSIDIDFDSPATSPTLDNRRLIIAAALPGAREEALRQLANELDFRVVRSDASVEMEIQIARLRSGCNAVRILQRELRFEEALAEARECGVHHLEFETLFDLGRYSEASALADYSQWVPDRIAAAIGAGNWSDAASSVEALDDGIPQRAFSCVAELLRIDGGDHEAARRLHELANKRGGACKVIEAIASRDVDQMVASARELPDHDDLRPILARIAWVYGYDDRDHAHDAIDALVGLIETDDRLWLAPFVIGANDTFATHTWLAVFHVYTNDFIAARDEVDKAFASLPADDNDRRDEARVLDIALQIREGVAPLVVDRLGPMHDVKAAYQVEPARNVDRLFEASWMWGREACAKDIRNAIITAAGGDGGPLAEVLGHCGITNLSGLALSVLPRVTRSRDAVTAAFHVSPLRSNMSSVQMPFSLLRQLALARDLARLTDDHVREHSLQQIIERHAAVLTDRDKVIALVLTDVL